jgi:hypothetical protein
LPRSCGPSDLQAPQLDHSDPRAVRLIEADAIFIDEVVQLDKKGFKYIDKLLRDLTGKTEESWARRGHGARKSGKSLPSWAIYSLLH